MEISGLIRTTCPPDILLSAMRDATTLSHLLPEGSTMTMTPQGDYDFLVTKSIGPIKLNLPGKMTLTPTGTGNDHILTAHAGNLIGGKVDLQLNLALQSHDGHTRLVYSGELTATGLAGRVMREHRARVNGVLKAAMNHIKIHAERQMPLGD
jgi:carbon monoxide dehydrogenase subunit G